MNRKLDRADGDQRIRYGWFSKQQKAYCGSSVYEKLNNMDECCEVTFVCFNSVDHETDWPDMVLVGAVGKYVARWLPVPYSGSPPRRHFGSIHITPIISGLFDAIIPGKASKAWRDPMDNMEELIQHLSEWLQKLDPIKAFLRTLMPWALRGHTCTTHIVSREPKRIKSVSD